MTSTKPRRAASLARRIGLLLPLLALFGCGSSSSGGDSGGGGPGFDDTLPPTIAYFPASGGYAIGFAMSLVPGVTGSPTSYSLISGSLPLGVKFHSKTGAFSGRPLQAGTTTLGVRVINSKGFADGYFDLQVTRPPAARFLYAANAQEDTLSAYTVDATSGALRNAGFVPAGDEPRVVAAAPGGRFVAVGASLSGDVSIFAIDALSGRPTPAAGSPTMVGSAVVEVLFHPDLRSLYVLAAADGTLDLIHAFSFDVQTGAIASLTPTPLPVPDGSTGLAADPLGRALYLAHPAGLRTFGVNPSGTLVDLGDVNPGHSFQDVAVLPDGSMVYAVNLTVQDVYRFATMTGGTLSLGFFAADLVGSQPLALALGGDGANLYVADGGGSLEQFTVNPGGSLTALVPATVAVGSGLAGLATSPAGGGAWVSRTGVNELVSLAPGAGGALTPDLETPVRTHLGPRGLALAPALTPVVMTTKNLFAANYDDDDFSQFAVGAGGVLGPLFPPLLMTGSKPVGIAVNPAREALYVCNEQDPALAIEAFAISVNGQATPLQQFSAAAGATALVLGVNGSWGHVVLDDVGETVLTVAVSASGTLSSVGSLAGVPVTGRPARHPGGGWLYLPDGVAGTVDTYRVDPLDGSLTKVDSDSADLGVNAVAVDPTGRFLYAVNGGSASDRVRGFAIDASDGTLVELITSPYAFDAMAKQAIDVAVHPSGRTLYVATRDSDLVPDEGSIHVYSIEVDPLSGPSLGALTLQGSPTTFPGEAPGDIEVDAAGTTLYVSIEQVLGRIEAYGLDGSGALSPVPLDVEDSGALTRAMALKRRAL